MKTATKNRVIPNGEPAPEPARESAAAARERKQHEKRVRVLRPIIQRMVVPIRSMPDCPLVMQKFSEKAKRMMADKQQHKATGPRKAKDPKEHYYGSMHVLPGADPTEPKPRLGFPASGFRRAMIQAAPQVNLKRPLVQGAVFVIASENDGLIPLQYKKIRMREDVKRNESGVADIRYRPEISDWTANVMVEYDESLLSAEQVVNLMARAGFSVGIGEERPGRGGEWGRWEVLEVAEVE
jgi:hypothetical protein